MHVRGYLSILLVLLVPLGSSVVLSEESPASGYQAQSRERSSAELTALGQRAEEGDAAAQYMLGLSYMGGSGVEQNYAEAAKWLRLAALQGQAAAQFTLGYLYQEGKGVTKNVSAT